MTDLTRKCDELHTRFGHASRMMSTRGVRSSQQCLRGIAHANPAAEPEEGNNSQKRQHLCASPLWYVSCSFHLVVGPVTERGVKQWPRKIP